MATTESDLKSLEEDVLDHLGEDAGGVEADLDRAAGAPEEVAPEEPVTRIAIAIAFPVIATAVMTGGVFTGTGPRIYGAVAGVMGIGLAIIANRQRRLAPMLAIVAIGIFVIGALMVVPTGVGNVGSLTKLVKEANTQGDLTRPPVPFIAGWHAVLGWLMAVVGFAAAWVALAFRKPALALVIPVPFAALGGISVPKDAQVASGIVVLVLFVFGLVLLSSNSGLEGSERPSTAYEVRNALRSLVVVIPVTVALILASQLDFLFPKPAVNPAEQPQKPKTTPLSKVVDRPLFRVTSTLTGPWRMGGLDVYDGSDWRLAAVNDANLKNVPKSGVIDPELTAGTTATFEIEGLTGAVLPGLANTVGLKAKGIVPAFDYRSSNIRLASGTLKRGQKYTVLAAGLPSIPDLEAVTDAPPADVLQFTQGVGTPPPAVQRLIDKYSSLPTLWDRFDALRNYVLDNVVATGLGVPVAITPQRADELLTKLEATPFEIVAMQAMLARWIGVPSRIGFGFDCGECEKIGAHTLDIRPRSGATWVEVYFPHFKWIPVVGAPRHAKPSVSSDPNQQQNNPNILPSDEVNIPVFLPTVTQPKSVFGKQLGRGFLIGVPIILFILLLYSTYPALRKARIRARRRNAATEMGPRARIALAYAEFRDVATDFGFSHPSDTPLMFLERLIEDDEHTELAWLVTRVLWGDLQTEASLELAIAAEELSRSLRRRLGGAQPATVRFVAAVSRLSLRNPFAPDLNTALGAKELADVAA